MYRCPKKCIHIYIYMYRCPKNVYTGCPKKCIHTLNDYNSLKLSFECHAFVSNLEMGSFIS